MPWPAGIRVLLRHSVALGKVWWWAQNWAQLHLTLESQERSRHRISCQEISYIAADKSFSGSVPQWLFLADFQPVSERKKKGR
jgi:hypothetical protein